VISRGVDDKLPILSNLPLRETLTSSKQCSEMVTRVDDQVTIFDILFAIPAVLRGGAADWRIIVIGTA
jgi:hypothetical protein